ncbi:MAG: NAD-dependent epimerase/dehydratase family protein [Planctomycetes bacterium]|nr:NAD-dependent epimerase/dehydratase family protein [Planctomycetota bacterium]
MKWSGRKVLVTGGSGFIGSHLTERLVELGAKVRLFLHYDMGGEVGLLRHSSRDVLGAIEPMWGDIKDADAVRSAVKGRDVVFHLAALIGIPYSYVNPRDVVDTNTIGTLNVLQAARNAGASKIVSTSTSEVYGTAKYAPIDEKHPLQGQSPYSASKIAADKLCESFHRSFDVPVAVIRPFNTFGPRQSARAVIPTIISQALTGDTVKLGSLSPKRDLNYVQNTVDGYIKVAESPKSVGEVINVGTGVEISIGDLAKKIVSLVGRKMRIVQEKKRVRPAKSEVGRLLCDWSKAKRLLKWQPRVSLEQGLRETIDWIGEHLDTYRPDVYNI